MMWNDLSKAVFSTPAVHEAEGGQILSSASECAGPEVGSEVLGHSPLATSTENGRLLKRNNNIFILQIILKLGSVSKRLKD